MNEYTSELRKLLADAISYIEYNNAYFSDMTLEQVEESVKDFRKSVSKLYVEHSGPDALAFFDIAKARAAVKL